MDLKLVCQPLLHNNNIITFSTLKLLNKTKFSECKWNNINCPVLLFLWSAGRAFAIVGFIVWHTGPTQQQAKLRCWTWNITFFLHWSQQRDVGLLYSKLILFQLFWHIQIWRMATWDKSDFLFFFKHKIQLLLYCHFLWPWAIIGENSYAQRMDQLQKLFTLPAFSKVTSWHFGAVFRLSFGMWKVCKPLIHFLELLQPHIWQVPASFDSQTKGP